MMSIKGPVHDEAIKIFYSNIFDENFWTLLFYSSVYKIPISINPNYISTFLGIPRVVDVILFPPRHMSKEYKAAMTRCLCEKTVRWTIKPTKSDCRPIVQFLFCIFTYILLPTTHRSGLTSHMAYLIDSILEGKRIDLPSVICYVFLRASATDHSTSSLPFPILISQILKA